MRVSNFLFPQSTTPGDDARVIAETLQEAILTDAQWKKYEEIKRDRPERGGRGGRPATMHGTTRPSTRPSEHDVN